jgi:uncharacterized protein
MSDSTVVLYHKDCADGFGAAFAAWTILGDPAVYVPVQYGEPMPLGQIPVGGTVYIVDFSYPREELISLAQRSNRVVVLDHHKTAREALEGLDGTVPGLSVTFDMDRSGAVLTWEYFHPGEPVPLLLRYVQDRDLWRWEMISSREFSAALALEPKDFQTWTNLREMVEDVNDRVAFLRRGAAVLKYQKSLVDSLASKAVMSDVGGHSVPAVNCPIFQSELGEELCKKYPDSPFAAVWFCPDEKSEIWSLRSRNGFDVSEVARSLGGGGHAAAAGFKRTRPQPKG